MISIMQCPFFKSKISLEYDIAMEVQNINKYSGMKHLHNWQTYIQSFVMVVENV